MLSSTMTAKFTPKLNQEQPDDQTTRPQTSPNNMYEAKVREVEVEGKFEQGKTYHVKT